MKQIDLRGYDSFAKTGADIVTAINLKIRALKHDQEQCLDELDRLIETKEEAIGMLLLLTAPGKSRRVEIVNALIQSYQYLQSEMQDLAAIATNLDTSSIYILDIEQVKRFGT